MTKSKDVLVLFSFQSHKLGYIEMLFERLSNAANKKGEVVLHRGALNELQISIIDNKMSIKESLTGRPLESFSLVYFELWYKAQQQALASAKYLRNSKVPFFSSEVEKIMPITKLGELSVMADNNIPLPNTFMSSNRQLKKVFKKNPPLAFPVIVKAVDGYGGKNNYLVRDYTQFKQILDDNKSLQFVVQEFIPNNCDYRCLVLGGEIQLLIKRERDAAGDSHLNNTSAGADGRVVDVASISPAAQQAVLRAAAVLGRSEFAGVDLMFNSETGDPYILEVNQTPQIEIGVEVDKKMNALLEYIERRMQS